MKETIRAQVSTRLLQKADRLFTGSLDGRIIEILQNARRAGATEVNVSNHDGWVTVRDNGQGIEDFGQLLDLGSSGWDDCLEQAEDPAGVGVFCLAPREVRIRSRHRSLMITERGWTGEALSVEPLDEPVAGTELEFRDDPWTLEIVEKHAVFSGMKVTVDGQACLQQDFVSDQAVAYPGLGCRIEVIPLKDLSGMHRQWKPNYSGNSAMINFHGQVIWFWHTLITESLVYLIDMTGEPTNLRLLLPARTQVVENEALERLKAALEKETYRFLQRRGHHRLSYSQYCRARELGIELPEATPTFRVGLIYDDDVEPIEVTKPEDLPLSRCYRLGKSCKDEFSEATVHLLAALGTFTSPFVPVEISDDYNGYHWADLPIVESVTIEAGRQLLSQWIWNERLTAVEELSVTVQTSDGKTFASEVPMAIRKPVAEKGWGDVEVLVTRTARERLNTTEIWYHLGGYYEEGDTYDTQVYQFEEQLDLFWAELIGPAAYLHSRLLEFLGGLKLKWKSLSIDQDHTLTITHPDGRQEIYPQPS